MQKPSPTITPRPTLEIVPATPGALAPLIATLAAIVRRVVSQPMPGAEPEVEETTE